MDKRLKQQLDFVLEIDKEKNILRQTHLSGHGRRENDAEHAWHMAIMSYLLREYSNESVDIAKVMLMCLIHDIVEIDAGDTFAYDEEGRKTQRPAKTLLKSVSSPSCRRIRKMSSSLSSTSLRTVKHLNPNMPMPWTIFNRFS